MANITAGTWSVKSQETERTPYGIHNRTVTRTISIVSKDYYGKGPRFYQTERTFWNGVQVHDGSYPADTEYAKTRRDGIAPF